MVHAVDPACRIGIAEKTVCREIDTSSIMPLTTTSLSVLIVDDLKDVADSAAEMLALAGHDAAAVYSAPDALDQVQHRSFDVILTDISMPGMDGVEMVRWMLAQPWRRRPFLIAVTGCTSDKDRERVKAAGVDLFLAKPVDPTVLTAVLSRIGQFLDSATV